MPRKNTVSTTTFQDQRQMISESSNRLGNLNNTPIELISSVSEIENTLNQTFAKPTLINTVTCNTSQTRGTDLLTFSFPDALVSKGGPSSVLLETFYLFRTGFRISARTNSVRMQQGRLILAWIPMDYRSPTDEDVYTLQNYPHVLIDFSNSSDVSLDISFQSVQTMLTTNVGTTFDTLGTAVLRVLNPLQIGPTGSNSANVSLYVEPKDTHLHLMGLRHTPMIPSFRFKQMQENLRFATRRQINQQLIRLLEEPDYSQLHIATEEMEQLEVIGEELMKTTSEIVSGNLTGALKTGLRGVANVMESFGLDKPINLEKDCKQVSLALSPINAGEGSSYVEQLDIVPQQTDITTKEQTGSAVDFLSIRNLTSLYSMFAIRSWTTNMVPGTQLLANCFVTPMLSYASSTEDYVTNFSPTFLAYNSAPFAYWTGSLKFRFEFVKTEFHTGRVIIFWVPNVSLFDSPVISLEDAQTFPNVIVDLQLAKEASITIPWNKPTPWAYTSSFNGYQRYYDPGTGTDQLSVNSCNGRLYLLVQNELVASGPVADNIEINCYISGGPDYALRARQYQFNDIGYEPPYQPAPPGVATEEMDTSEVESSLAQVSFTPAHSALELGERINRPTSNTFPDMYKEQEMDLRFLLKSYVPIDIDLFDAPTAIPVRPVYTYQYAAPPTSLGIKGADIISHYLNQFVFYRGGMNFKILFAANKNRSISGIIYHDVSYQEFGTNPTYTYTPQYSITDGARYGQPFNLAFQDCIQVGVPFKTIYQNILIQSTDTDAPSLATSLGKLVLQFYRVNRDEIPDKMAYTLFRSLADDFNAHLVVAPPRQNVRFANPPPPPVE
jgi:hypothetical protein